MHNLTLILKLPDGHSKVCSGTRYALVNLTLLTVTDHAELSGLPFYLYVSSKLSAVFVTQCVSCVGQSAAVIFGTVMIMKGTTRK